MNEFGCRGQRVFERQPGGADGIARRIPLMRLMTSPEGALISCSGRGRSERPDWLCSASEPNKRRKTQRQGTSGVRRSLQQRACVEEESEHGRSGGAHYRRERERRCVGAGHVEQPAGHRDANDPWNSRKYIAESVYRRAAAQGECASRIASRKAAETARPAHCTSLRAEVTLLPRSIMRSETTAASLVAANIASHGAAENRPAFAALSPCTLRN
jgi:hypothetical protein